VGFGKSDKPKKETAHSFSWHRQVLLEWVERLDLHNIVLVVQDWGGLLGLTLPPAATHRYAGLLVMNTTLATGETPLSKGFEDWAAMCARTPEYDIARLLTRSNPGMPDAQSAAYSAPFPDAGHRAATRAFPALVPKHTGADGAEVSREAKRFWQTKWHGKTLMAVGMQDPVLGPDAMQALRSHLAGCPEPLYLATAGHFVPEQGESVARAAISHFGGCARVKL
jgi:tRNA(adenine34) deaminase